MWEHYTEEDTERARQAEQAAMQQPAHSQLPSGPKVTRSTRQNLLALAMISAGLMMLLGRSIPNSGDMMGGMVLLTIASCFLFFAFWLRIYGLMIPGSILAGLSIGIPFADLTEGVSVLWGLALGFLGIFLVGRVYFNVRSKWPVIPAVILFAVGTIGAFAQMPAFFAGGLVWLPLLLIGAGLYLGWNRR